MHTHTRNHPYLLKGRAGLWVRGQMSIWGTQATWPPLLCSRISDQHEVLSGGPVASVLCHQLTLESARVKAGSSPTPTQEFIRCSHSFSDEETEPQREVSSQANVTAIPEKWPPRSCNRSLPVRCLPRPSPPAPTPLVCEPFRAALENSDWESYQQPWTHCGHRDQTELWTLASSTPSPTQHSWAHMAATGSSPARGLPEP